MKRKKKQLKGDRKGYSSDDILYFCNEHKIKCFGYDWKMQQFITNKNEQIDFNKNLPAFVFYFNDSHIYLINDTTMRQSLLHSNDKSDILSLMIKEANKNKNDNDNKVDIPFEEWGEGENTNIYITGQRVVNNAFYKLICDGEVYNVGGHYEISNLELTVEILRHFQGDKSLISYVPDRLGHDFRYSVDDKKIRKNLDFENYVSFEEGLTKTVEWYKNHPAWWRKLK